MTNVEKHANSILINGYCEVRTTLGYKRNVQECTSTVLVLALMSFPAYQSTTDSSHILLNGLSPD